MSKQNTPEKQNTESTSEKPLPDKIKSVTDRLKKAWDKATEEKNVPLVKRIFVFIGTLFSEYETLSVEQQKVDKEETEKIASVISNLKEEDISKTVKAELAGSSLGKLPKEQEETVDTFSGIISKTYKNDLSQEEQTEVARSGDMITSEKKDIPLTADRKLLLGYFGLKALRNLKLYFTQKGLSPEAIEKELDNFENATAQGKGPNYFKQPQVKEFVKFGKLDIFSMPRKLLDKLENPLNLMSLGDKDWAQEDKEKVKVAFRSLFPDTAKNPDSLDKIIETIHDIASNKRSVTNKDLSVLIYHVATNDLETLANLIH